MKIGTTVGELQTRKQGTVRLKMATSASCSQEDAVAVYLEDGDIEGATLEEPLEALVACVSWKRGSFHIYAKKQGGIWYC